MRREAMFGITQYVNPESKRFSCSIKHRYSDFHVNEIDLKGRVVHLNSLEIPQIEQVLESNDEIELDDEAKCKAIADYIEDPTLGEKLLLVLREGNTLETEPIVEKEKRKQLHQLTRKYFDNRIGTSTNAELGSVVFEPFIKQKHGDRKRHKASALKKDKFCHFSLYKEDRDTMDCINIVARILRIPNKSFTFAGTKDRRAVTVQRVSVEKIAAERLAGLNKSAKNFFLGDFNYSPQRLSLGDLLGNRFRIILRRLNGISTNELEKKIDFIKKNGFVNYYGLQRFGTRSIPTSDAGKALLAGDYKSVVDMILKPSDEDTGDFKVARMNWAENQDVEQALKLFPKSCIAERAILNSFQKMGKTDSYLSAIQAIPRNLRLIYVHAYQSLVWNEMATERIKRFGFSPVVGDLVLEESINHENEESLDEAIIKRRESKQQPKILQTTEEAQKYKIEDVVLPLPGVDMVYPLNLIDCYKEYMKKDGFDPDDMVRNIKDLQLKGFYRHIIAIPKEVAWSIVDYDNDDEELIVSDLKKLKGESAENIKPKEANNSQKALYLEFNLLSSQYATMLLRELTRDETGSGYQASFELPMKRNAEEALSKESFS